MYVFYADVFVMENSLIHIAVLHGIMHLQKKKGRRYVLRIVAASICGAVLALLVLLLAGQSTLLYMGYSYGLVLPFLLVVSFGIPDFRIFFQEYAEGILFMALISGVSEAVANVCRIRKLPFLAFFAIAIVLAVEAEHFVRFCLLKKKLLTVTLVNGAKHAAVLGLYDSGNRLREPYEGRGVHIVAQPLWEKLAGESKEGCRLIPYQALSGNGLLRIYTISELIVSEAGMEKQIAPAVIGVAKPELFLGKDYQIILNQEVDMK